MARKIIGLGLVAGALAASPASAGIKQDFEACDGRVHPAKADDGMRGEAGGSPFSFALTRLSETGSIAACDRALASDRLLPTQTLRKAHLLRARAAARLRGDDPAGAIKDLDLAAAAVADRANERFYRRSMGVSLDLLRAIALTQQKQDSQAVALAAGAMAARPFSSQVQRIGAEILHVAGPSGNAESWSQAMRLDPAAAATVLIRSFEAGDFARVAAMRDSVPLTWPQQSPTVFQLLAPAGGGGEILTTVSLASTTAYALAATGKPAEAKAALADLRARLKAMPKATDQKGAPLSGPDLGTFLSEALSGRFRGIEARIAVAEGRPMDAVPMLVGAKLPGDASSAELLTALKAALPAKDAALVPAADTIVRPSDDSSRRKGLTRLAADTLFSPETPRAVIDYEKSRPDILGALVGGALSMGTTLLGGIRRLDGFRSTDNPDGTIKVEFVGNTPSALLVQEMTLLRAAEIARAKSKPAFEIVARKDYQRVLQMSRGGVPVSSTPQGYKTELTIRPLDQNATTARKLDALAVIDALGPLYYEGKPTKG